MKRLAPLILAGAAVPLATAWGEATTVPVQPVSIPGVTNPAQARIDYMLKCQGCHRPDGTGDMSNTPPLKGEVARFLAVEGGREFVVRVPGVAMTNLNDRRLAQLLNWTLHRFDAGHVPANFKPYTEAEIAALRRDPLRLDRITTRERLVGRIRDD